MLVVLAWKVKEFFDRKAEEDRERIKAERERIEEDRERIKADRERIIAEVRAEGMAEGMAEGRAEGRAEGEAIALARRREAERLGMETSDSIDAIYQRLRDEGWQPPQA